MIVLNLPLILVLAVPAFEQIRSVLASYRSDLLGNMQLPAG